MRSIFLPKPLLAAALGGLVLLTAFGASAASAAPAPTATVTATDYDDAEMQFLDLESILWQACEPDVSGATVVASASTTATEPPLDSTQPVAVDPVPLTAEEQCVAQRHQARISKAFSGTSTTTYDQLLTKLTSLRYPAARIYRMPDFSGRPVVRVDLRLGSDHLAVQVTALSRGVMVEAFGAPEGVNVTDVHLQPELDFPTF
ncbi:hypothetical protein LRD69_17335 [Streptomyces sp. JH14]|uniref:hypothetical protein n=1 Tax=Streptomyces sp. JH14 TaxID=2793630 RepID=UPI0023F93520|nr:hypothetical protein [Streptomyces sp. JH14]MDF6043861.1 hypothetical protein [Streptomyces sp. JH14]